MYSIIIIITTIIHKLANFYDITLADTDCSQLMSKVIIVVYCPLPCLSTTPLDFSSPNVTSGSLQIVLHLK